MELKKSALNLAGRENAWKQWRNANSCLNVEHQRLRSSVKANSLDCGAPLTQDSAVFFVVFKTFEEADTKHDGKIDRDEWKSLVYQHPSLLKNMTLHYLKDITTAFPSFVFYLQVDGNVP
ncbi:hypothetical protein KP509_18G046200 [Ceratopteris richardii]|uniref:EF-hand domain-containing protein n=1 Tax=Ceratopteris richardii TaxID=49495 RepID=A0A8T2SPB6_CERRI|nr:hypothetical protein KP509_18G046200 [Ceratopteris richardii]